MHSAVYTVSRMKTQMYWDIKCFLILSSDQAVCDGPERGSSDVKVVLYIPGLRHIADLGVDGVLQRAQLQF